MAAEGASMQEQQASSQQAGSADDAALAQERERVKALKDSLDRAYAERDRLARSLEGINPDEAKKALQFVREHAERQAIEKGEFEKLRAQLVSEHQAEIAKKDERAAYYRAALESHILRGDALRALAESGVENPDLLLPHVLAGAVVIEEDGEYVVRVKDGRGYRYGKSGKPLTLRELVEQDLRERFPQAFPAKMGSGADAQGGRHGGAGDGKLRVTRAQFDAMSPAEQMKFILAGGVPDAG